LNYRLDVNAYYALGIPAYFLLMGWEWMRMKRRGQNVYGFADTIGNLSGGLGEITIGLLIGPLLIALYDFGYSHIALIHWPKGSWIPWILAFVLSDLCYYWYHRAGHVVPALWAIHGVHHQSENFNVTVAMRHPWLSDTYSAVFYIPLPLLGIPPTHFFFAISVISFYALSVHTRTLNRPAFGVFVTPATHIVHHARNPRYYGKNLGAMFSVWDKLFGTHTEVDPAEPPVIGGGSAYETHDGAKAQWIYWRDLLRGRKSPVSHACSDTAIPIRVKVYVGLQFLLLAGGATVLLWNRDALPLTPLLVSIAAILWSTSALGGLLDGRPRAAVHEAVRLGVLAALAVSHFAV
jgi:sterol desaturase/sphingolipid hydroxylase (fatty acid hydroxylase superfamily)